MAAAIKEATGADAELIGGGGGIFDVEVDGKLIYSKHQTGEFPSNEEVVAQLTG